MSWTVHLRSDMLTTSPKDCINGLMSILQHTFPPDLTGIYDEKLANQLANTQGAISSLNQLDRLLHNTDLLMHPILGKEAESSSQLEGTQASIEDAYKIDIMEQTDEERHEAAEIRNYERAMHTGLRILSEFPLDKFAIREVHKTLLSGVRGKDKHPGEFRKREVWIGVDGTQKGNSRYVAPDPTQVDPLVERLVAYVNNSGSTHPLIVSGIIHHRFEAIHPFEDGNGRTGRLLISLYLIKKGVLKLPVLYPSGYFEKNKRLYMDMLSGVDKEQNWYDWLMFFLKGLEEQSKLSLNIGLNIDSLYKQEREKIRNETKAGISLINALEYTFTRFYVTAPLLHKDRSIPLTSCKRYLEILSKERILEDLGIHNKQRVFANLKLLDLLKNI